MGKLSPKPKLPKHRGQADWADFRRAMKLGPPVVPFDRFFFLVGRVPLLK